MTYFKSWSATSSTAIVLSLLLSACGGQKNASSEGSEKKTTSDELKTLTIGYQKSSLNSIVLKSDAQLLSKEFPNTKVEWKEFPAGPQMLEALSVGSIDLGSVGNTPPIFAQAANKHIVYVGYENVHPKWQSVLVPKDSPIQSIEDLKGKKIAVQKGSSAHDLLGRVLQKAHLTWSDIQPIWLAPADARAALDKKSIDAWAIWEPFLSAAEVEGQARSIVDGTTFESTYNFLISRPDFVKNHPSEVKKYIQSSNNAAQWIVDHPSETLSLYSKTIGLNTDIAQRVLDKRYKPSIVNELKPEVVEAQQRIADRFSEEKLIPQKLDVKQAVWQSQ